MRSIPSYNVMGLAKASLEANVRFLAADLGPAECARQRHFRRADQDLSARRHAAVSAKCSNHVAKVAPIRRNVTLEDVGNAAAFLCSDLAAGMTGEILYVDGGFSTVGMSFADEVRRIAAHRPKGPLSRRLSPQLSSAPAATHARTSSICAWLSAPPLSGMRWPEMPGDP